MGSNNRDKEKLGIRVINLKGERFIYSVHLMISLF